MLDQAVENLVAFKYRAPGAKSRGKAPFTGVSSTSGREAAPRNAKGRSRAHGVRDVAQVKKNDADTKFAQKTTL